MLQLSFLSALPSCSKGIGGKSEVHAMCILHGN